MRKTIKLFSLMATLALAMVSKMVWADAAAAPAATPSPAPTPAVSVNGFVDGYYTYNFTNSSAGKVGAGNLGYNFNSADDTFNLGLGEVDVNAVLGSTSGHLSLITGDSAGLIMGTGTYGVGVLQAYVSYAPGQWTFNLGRFVTWMGNEVIQSKSNMNYSRSLLFVYTIPYFNQGLSVGWATSDSKVAVTGYMTQGWNNSGVLFSAGPMGDGADLGKTYGLEAKYAPDANFSVVLNGIMGPNGGAGTFFNPDTTKSVGEAIITVVPGGGAWSFALDAEAGSTSLGAVTVTANDGTTKISSLPFWGAALYGRYQISSDWAAALRLEQVVDTDGYGLGLYGLIPQTPTTGKGSNDVTADEVTLTIEHNLSSNLLFRLEGRMDMASSGGTQYAPITPSSTITVPGTFAGGSGTQTTGTASAVMSF